MSWSLNEVEGLARKAARGAGFSWGLAEEAGKATRWLAAAGLPGAQALAGWLDQCDGKDYATLCPNGEASDWQAGGGLLCPVISGACLCDRADFLALGHGITLGRTAYPILLLPALASASDLSETGLALSWPGVRLTRINRETWIEANDDALTAPEQPHITVATADAPSGQRLRRTYRGEISADIAARLTAFAHRTYAPDTLESRLAGAGAGLTDND